MTDNRKSKEELDKVINEITSEDNPTPDNKPDQPPAKPDADDNKDDEMDLKSVLEKEKEDLQDDELEFLKQHAGELTEEQKQEYGLSAPPKEPTAPPPLEDRYKNQQKENQVLFAKQKKFNETVTAAASLPDPTEDELKVEYPEWEDMTEFEKKLAKDNLVNKRRFEMVHEATLEGQKLDEWVNKVDEFLVTGTATYSKLVGKEEDFKSFCLKPTRRGLDMEDLVKAFLFDADENPPPKKRGSLLEPGSAGGGQKPPQEGISETQAAELRVKNHKLYNKLVREGKIKIEV